MVSLCSHMTDGASSLQRRAFGKQEERGGGGKRVRVALKVAVPLSAQVTASILKAARAGNRCTDEKFNIFVLHR